MNPTRRVEAAGSAGAAHAEMRDLNERTRREGRSFTASEQRRWDELDASFERARSEAEQWKRRTPSCGWPAASLRRSRSSAGGGTRRVDEPTAAATSSVG